MYAKEQGAFLHVINSFVVTLFFMIAIRPRIVMAFFAATATLTLGSLYAVFSEISLGARLAGSPFPAWNPAQEAGLIGFGMLMNLGGALLAILFHYLIGSPPMVTVSEVQAKAGAFGRFTSFFLFMVVIPLAFSAGGAGLLQIPYGYDKLTWIWRPEILVYGGVMDILFIILFLAARAYGAGHFASLMHYTGADESGLDDKNVTAEEESLISRHQPEIVLKDFAKLKILARRRLDSVFLAFMIATNIIYLVMMFVFIDPFYWQILVAVGIVALVLFVMRLIMGAFHDSWPDSYTYVLPSTRVLSFTNSGIAPMSRGGVAHTE
jgi:hypothetical protein